MTRELIAGLTLLIVPSIAALIFFRTRQRRIQQEKIIFEIPKFSGDNNLGEILYVSTVFASDLLSKVWAQGLGHRGNATLWLGDGGIGISRNGEAGFLIPTNALTSLSETGATIDRGVEAKGLMAISWQHKDIGLVTNIRFRDRQQHDMAKAQVIEKLGVSFA
jgi:hypothetical protein